MPRILTPDELRPPCRDAELPFETTAELEPLEGVIGHDRAMEALHVGLGIRRGGYNIFVAGEPGVGKHTVIMKHLRDRAAREKTPNDWCYVINFDDPHRPRALELPPGEGARLKDVMARFTEELREVLAVLFTSDAYTSRVHAITEAMEKVHDQALEAVKEKAIERGLAFVSTEEGFTFLPARDGEPIPAEQFEDLTDEERKRFQGLLEETEDELQAIFQGVPRWRKETRDRLKALEKSVVEAEVSRLMDPILAAYKDYAEVTSFLQAVVKDIPNEVHLFREDAPSDDGDEDDDGDAQAMLGRSSGPSNKPEIRRYQVNVLVDHAKTQGAPVIYEDIPAIVNLIGRIEHLAEYGALFTDHTLIKAGAFHLASGGYLVLDAWRLITAPFGWAALKRVLRSKLVRMDGFAEQTHPMSTVMLTPDPIPVDVKVVLMGPPELYYELSATDPEMERHFKILAAFEDRVPRTAETTLLLARLIGTKLRETSLLPFRRDAVMALVEQSAREADDNEFLSANLASLFNLMDEADFWAREAASDVVRRDDVARALAAFERRSSQPRDEQFDGIRREILLVRTQGALVGEINALAVVQLGQFSFGRVSRVSATVRAGPGEVIDIERESDMAGSIHAKGVLILQSLLGSRYARDIPLSLSASLTFEQTYTIVDGDSASCAEFCALVSAIAEVPIRQSIAVTGAINQRGEVQAVGGLNAKIEGFYDICAMRGLKGNEGVIIPKANLKQLMLKPEVVEAVREGRFSIWAVTEADEALELLTGLPVGVRGPDGHYPPDTIHHLVEARLASFLEVRRKLHPSA